MSTSILKRDPVQEMMTGFAYVMTKTNRIISGKPVRVSYGRHPSFGNAAGWTNGLDIVFNEGLIKLDLTTAIAAKLGGDMDKWSKTMMAMLGLNYHELSHVLYTPSPTVKFRAEMIRKSNRWTLQSWNILEDQRIELLFWSRYLPTEPYFTWMAMQWVISSGKNDTWRSVASAYPFIAMRKYLPFKFRSRVRAAMRKVMDAHLDGSSIAHNKFAAINSGAEFVDRVDELVRQYISIDVLNERKTRAILLIIEEFSWLRTLAVAATGDSRDGLDPHDMNTGGQTADSEDARQEQKNAVSSAQELLDELDEEDDEEEDEDGGYSSSDDEQDDQGDSDSGEDEDDADGEGDADSCDDDSDADGDADGDSESDGEDGDDSDESTDDDGASDGIGESPDEFDDDEGSDGAGSTRDDKFDPTAVPDFDVKEMVEQLSEELLDDDDVQQDLDNTHKSIDDTIEKSEHRSTLPYRPARDATADRAVHSSINRMIDTIKQLRTGLEEHWVDEETSGRLNIRQAIKRKVVVGPFDVFDDWEPSTEAEGGVEAVVCLDVSMSMKPRYGGASAVDHERPSMIAAWQIKRMFDSIDMPCTVITFGSKECLLYEAHDRASEKTYRHAAATDGSTDGARALVEAARIFDKSHQPNHILLMVTDGEFSDLVEVNTLFTAMNANDVTTVLIKLGGSFKQQLTASIQQVLNDPSSLVKITKELVDRVTRKALAQR